MGDMEGDIIVVHSSCNPRRVIDQTIENIKNEDSALGASLSEQGLNENNVKILSRRIFKYSNLLVEGDMIATDHIISTLRLLYDPCNIKLKNSWEIGSSEEEILSNKQFMLTIRHSNIVLICGPLGNLLTSIFLKKTNLSWLFDDERKNILRVQPDNNKNILESKLSSNSTLHHDYGVFLKTRNPYDHSKNLYAIMGIHAYGTQGAAALSTNIESAKELISTGRPQYLEGLNADLDYITWIEVWRKRDKELNKFTDPALTYRIAYPTLPGFDPKEYHNPSQIFETQSTLRANLLKNTIFLGTSFGKALCYSLAVFLFVSLLFLLLLTNINKVLILSALIFSGTIMYKAFFSILMPPVKRER